MTFSKEDEKFPASKSLLEPHRACSLSIIVFAVLVCFYSATRAQFIGDDFTNLRLLSLYPLEMIVSGLSGSHMLEPSFGQHYRPALTFFYLIDVLIWGINPVALHASNLIWHCMTSLLCFFLLNEILQFYALKNHASLAFWSSLIFALHPFHGETICWWIAKHDIVVCFWYLLAFFLFIRAFRNGARAPLILSWLAYALALGCKESALTFPAVLMAFLFFADEKGTVFERLKCAARKSLPFWSILALFWILRAIMLRTVFGGYYGLFENFKDRVLSTLAYADLGIILGVFCPFSIDSNILLKLCASVFLFLCAFGFYSLARFIHLEQARAVRQLIKFALCFMFLSFLPAALIWFPSRDFVNVRLLYLVVLPVCLFLPISLLASPEERKTGRPLLFIFCLSLAIGSIDLEERWVAAGRAFTDFRADLKRELDAVPEGRRLLVVNMPAEYKGRPLFLLFIFLRDMFRDPFFRELSWQRLGAMAPHFFGRSDFVNPSILREKAAEPLKYRFLLCRKSSEGWNLEPLLLDRLVDRKPAPPLFLKVVEQSLQKDVAYAFMRLPAPVSGADYQFLRIKFSNRSSNSQPAVVYWKNKEIAGFSLEKNRYGLPPNMHTDADTLTVYLGGILDWCLGQNIDAISVAAPGDRHVVSAELLSDCNLMPVFKAVSSLNLESADSVLRARDGKIYFDFDVSGIPDSDSILVELSNACHEFNALSGCVVQSSRSQRVLASIGLSGRKGRFYVSERLGDPVWHQLRILALDKSGSVAGYPSDPFYIQSVPGKASPRFCEMVDISAASADKDRAPASAKGASGIQ